MTIMDTDFLVVLFFTLMPFIVMGPDELLHTLTVGGNYQ